MTLSAQGEHAKPPDGRPVRSRRAARIASIAVVALSIIAALAVIEGVLRFTLQPTPPSDRFLFITPGSFRNVADNVPGYEANANVREIAVYMVPQADSPERQFFLEYDVNFRTNNQGHVQLTDTFCHRDTIAVVGDSFTQAEGNVPWFYDLERDAASRGASPQLLNLGIMGTGINSFRQTLDYYRGCYDISKVVVVFIGDDWYRPRWGFDTDQLDCLSARIPCREGQSIFFRMPASVTDEAIRDSVRERSRDRYKPSALRLLDLRSRANRAFKEWMRYRASKDSFLSIMHTFGKDNVRLIQVSMRQETGAQPQTPQTRSALEWIAQNGFDVSACPLTAEDYLPHDVHPNKAGYGKIRQCVETAIENVTQQRMFQSTGLSPPRAPLGSLAGK